MVRLISVLAAGTILAGCATQAEPVLVPAAPVTAEPAPIEQLPPAVQAEIGTFGFDLSGMDRSVAPGNNFYQYANGTWARTTPIPADRSNYGMFTMLDDLSKQRTREIIEETAGDPNNKIGAAYASFIDEAAIEAKGLEPFEPWLSQVRALDSRDEYEELLTAAERMG